MRKRWRQTLRLVWRYSLESPLSVLCSRSRQSLDALHAGLVHVQTLFRQPVGTRNEGEQFGEGRGLREVLVHRNYHFDIGDQATTATSFLAWRE